MVEQSMNRNIIKEWQYHGYRLTVVWISHYDELVDRLTSLGADDSILTRLKGHHCGYVETDKIIPQELAERDIDVHGGVTYCEYSEGKATYGFDCAHAGDTDDYWNLERVTAETERLANNIIMYEI